MTEANEGAGEPREPSGSYLAGSPPIVDDAKIARAGIRKLQSRYLTLYTDLPSRPAIDELPEVFDAAIDPWCRYFSINQERLKGWRIVGCLMRDRSRFLATGLLSESEPPFEHGHQRGFQLWCYDKPSDYYRRHLLLHEGVHALMAHFLGGCGPPWYMEGMAEMLALHRWRDGKLEVGILPPPTDEVALWGRIKAIRTSIDSGRWLGIHDVFAYGPTAHLRVESYAFSWAACVFLSRHPRYRSSFSQLQDLTRNRPAFEQTVETAFRLDDAELAEDWQVFLREVDYGFSMEASIIVRRDTEFVPSSGATFALDPRRGWQSTGMILRHGTTYAVQAGGEVIVRQGRPNWPTTVEGITVHYYRGRPLGRLLYALRPVRFSPGVLSPLVDGRPLGLTARLTPSADSVLYVRINEKSGELSDNRGAFMIEVRPGGRE